MTIAQFEQHISEDAKAKQEQFRKDLFLRREQEYFEQLRAQAFVYERQYKQLVEKYSLRNKEDKIVGDPWDNAANHTADILNKGTDATNAEWKNSILALLGAYAGYAEAMHCDLEGAVKMPIKNRAYSFFNRPPSMSDFIEQGKQAIPILTHNVSINEAEGLVVKLVKDKMPLQEELNTLFTEVVHSWLSEQGYQRGQSEETKNQFFNRNGIKLTLEKITELQANSETSLQSYLENNGHLSYQASLS